MLKILLVDDEALIRQYLSQCIADSLREGESLVQCSSGSETLMYLESNPVDLIFADITMPKMSGIELIDAVKEQYPKTDIVMLTCHEDFDYLRTVMQKNAMDYILKNEVSKEYFTKYLEAYRKKRQARDPENTVTLVQRILRATLKGLERNWIGCAEELELACSDMNNIEINLDTAGIIFLPFQKSMAENGIVFSGVDEKKIQNCKNIEEMQDLIGHWASYLRQQKPAYSETIASVLTYIQNHYAEEISVKTIAEAVFLNSDYLSRQFKKEVGVNLSEYIQKLRLEQARLLLLNTNMKISDIAIEVGFNNFSHFSTVFSKAYGCKPSQMQKQSGNSPLKII